MKKEVLFAIILGIIAGSIVMYGVYTARNAMTLSQQKRIEATPTAPASPTSEVVVNKSSMTITSPQNGTLTDKSNMTFSGKSFPGAIVVILNNGKETVTDADNNGNFSVELTLEGGSNYLETTSTSQDGKQEFDSRFVVFSTANLDEIPPEATGSATPKPSTSPKPSSSPKASPASSPKAQPAKVQESR
jgi:hypothetical protein